MYLHIYLPHSGCCKEDLPPPTSDQIQIQGQRSITITTILHMTTATTARLTDLHSTFPLSLRVLSSIWSLHWLHVRGTRTSNAALELNRTYLTTKTSTPEKVVQLLFLSLYVRTFHTVIL